MKILLGIALCIAGVVLGLYVGVWLCLIGGIVQVINEIRTPDEIEAMSIAVGVARVMLASLAGWLSAVALLFPGVALVQSQL